MSVSEHEHDCESSSLANCETRGFCRCECGAIAEPNGDPQRAWTLPQQFCSNETPCRSCKEWDAVNEAMDMPREGARTSALPVSSIGRKNIPLARGLFDYFPAALAEVARVSQAGNDKHNPGEDMHWARGKSMDHADCIMRHLIDRGTADPEDGLSHSGKMAWRALALLQEELEAAGAPLPRGART